MPLVFYCLIYLPFTLFQLLTSQSEEMDSEEVPSAPSTPATPGTPGAPLFGGHRFEKPNLVRKSSFLRSCKCFSTVEEWTLEDGAMPRVSCSLPAPQIPLAKKVHNITTSKLHSAKFFFFL